MELFRPDAPISMESQDRFQRYHYAKRIAAITAAAKYPKSLVVGIYGKWGEGKTSVLNCIKAEIGDQAVIIDFNPWHFSDENQLLKAFFTSIAVALGRSLKSKKERATEFMSNYADSIGGLVDLAAPGASSFFKIGKKWSERLMRNSIDHIKRKVDDLIIEANVNFVIFIDDIDRLDIHEIQAVFKLVKLVGDFPRTSYILSFDDEMVAKALAPKYTGNGNNSGHTFLEKIIQMPLPLPKADPAALRKYSLDLLNNSLEYLKIDLSDQEGREFISKFDKAFLPALSNPRLAVRYANSIGFSIPLLIDEVNISDLMVLEGIKTFYPELYTFIKNNSDHFISNFEKFDGLYTNFLQKERDQIKKSIDNELSRYPPYSEYIRSMLIDLFPQLRKLYHGYSYALENYEKWYLEKRICSPHYFGRYFSLVVRDTDISDVYFNNLLSGLDKENINIFYERFKIELPKLDPNAFLFKLRIYVQPLGEREAATLAVLLSKFGSRFPDENNVLRFSLQSDAISLIRNLLTKVERSNRLKIASVVLNNAQPLSFAIEAFRNLSSSKERIEDEIFLELDEIELLGNIIVDRVKRIMVTEDIFEVLPDFNLWWIFNLYLAKGKSSEITNLIAERISESANFSLRVIKIFTPTISSSTKASSYKANFTRESYEEIARFIDADVLYNATLEAFGQPKEVAVKDPKHDELTDDNLIALFQKMYREVTMNTKSDDAVNPSDLG